MSGLIAGKCGLQTTISELVPNLCSGAFGHLGYLHRNLMYFLRLKRTPQIFAIVGYSLIDLIDLIRLVTILKASSA